MNYETILRLLIGILYVGIVVLVMRYRLRAQAGEHYDLQEEGVAIGVPLRAAGLALWLYLPLYVLFPRLMEWSTLEVPLGLRLAALAFAGLVIPPFAHWAQRSLGSNVSPTVITKENHQLVTNGPYQYIRHPLYTAGFLFFIAMALAAGSWFLLLVIAIATPVLLARTPKEEARLLEHFGEEYRRYQEQTGRFFPRLGRS